MLQLVHILQSAQIRRVLLILGSSSDIVAPLHAVRLTGIIEFRQWLQKDHRGCEDAIELLLKELCLAQEEIHISS